MTMTPTLRDALAAARINRLKARIARTWAQRQREAEADDAGDLPICPGCGKRHAPRVGLFDLLRGDVDLDAPPAPDKSHH
jgi:hypothetical protein